LLPAAGFRRVPRTKGLKTLSDNPPLPFFPPPFPFRLPGNGGGIAFRPGHHHRITLAR